MIYRTCPILRIGIVESPKTAAIDPRGIPTAAPNPVDEITADAAPSSTAEPLVMEMAISEAIARRLNRFARLPRFFTSFRRNSSASSIFLRRYVGISTEHLDAERPLVRALYRFHTYYHVRRILSRIRVPTPSQEGFDNNGITTPSLWRRLGELEMSMGAVRRT